MAQPALSRYIHADVLARVGQLEFVPRGLVEGTLAGSHRSPFHGFAIEFAGHRQYAPGDDLRHLDWRVFFRSRRYVIKQYEMETNLVCHIALDASASMRYGEGEQNKLAYASRIAATLAYLVIEQRDRTSMSVFTDQLIARLPASNSPSQLIRLTGLLEGTEAADKTSLARPLLELAAGAGRRSIVVLLTDAYGDLGELDAALQRLRFDRHEIVVFQVLHRDEIRFDLPGLIRFVGLEEDVSLIARPDDIRRQYLAAFEAHQKALADVCHANQAEWVVAPTDRPLADLLADYLQSRLAFAGRSMAAR